MGHCYRRAEAEARQELTARVAQAKAEAKANAEKELEKQLAEETGRIETEAYGRGVDAALSLGRRTQDELKIAQKEIEKLKAELAKCRCGRTDVAQAGSAESGIGGDHVRGSGTVDAGDIDSGAAPSGAVKSDVAGAGAIDPGTITAGTIDRGSDVPSTTSAGTEEQGNPPSSPVPQSPRPAPNSRNGNEPEPTTIPLAPSQGKLTVLPASSNTGADSGRKETAEPSHCGKQDVNKPTAESAIPSSSTSPHQTPQPPVHSSRGTECHPTTVPLPPSPTEAPAAPGSSLPGPDGHGDQNPPAEASGWKTEAASTVAPEPAPSSASAKPSPLPRDLVHAGNGINQELTPVLPPPSAAMSSSPAQSPAAQQTTADHAGTQPLEQSRKPLRLVLKAPKPAPSTPPPSPPPSQSPPTSNRRPVTAEEVDELEASFSSLSVVDREEEAAKQAAEGDIEMGDDTECPGPNTTVGGNADTMDGVVRTETVHVPDCAEVEMGDDADEGQGESGEPNDVDMDVENGDCLGDDDAMDPDVLSQVSSADSNDRDLGPASDGSEDEDSDDSDDEADKRVDPKLRDQRIEASAANMDARRAAIAATREKIKEQVRRRAAESEARAQAQKDQSEDSENSEPESDDDDSDDDDARLKAIEAKMRRAGEQAARIQAQRDEEIKAKQARKKNGGPMDPEDSQWPDSGNDSDIDSDDAHPKPRNNGKGKEPDSDDDSENEYEHGEDGFRISTFGGYVRKQRK